jgi:centrosomal protein CEP290
VQKQLEQKISFYENRLKESETRVNELEDHIAGKEKELIEALTRLREYESGDYQLQQAVDEIKGLKNQIKVRDRDIQKSIQNINKLDAILYDTMEDNDNLRSKLGMGPKKKLSVDELNNLRAVKSQENRVQMYLLQREVTNCHHLPFLTCLYLYSSTTS